MPEREALALMQAIDDYVDAYGRDPAFAELVEALAGVKEEVQAARGEGGPEPESPGNQAAREAGEQPPEGVREARREDVSRGAEEGEQTFEEAGREARGRMKEGARAAGGGTARRRRGRY